jgi:glycerol dehydrogenase
MLKIFGSPSRYLQGPQALSEMGPYIARLGASAVLIADRTVLSLIGERVLDVCRASGVACEALEFSGEIIPREVERLARLARTSNPAFVFGAGGGKGIDAGKAVAHALDLPVVTIPTAASNDAPTSKNYVLYDESHRLLRVEHMKANPEVVVVDTSLIVTAPAHMFTAGIGDAIVKKFEVEQCSRAGGPNMFGARGCQAAVALANLCYETLRERGVSALHAVRQHTVDEDVEHVVEATVLLSGLGFESGGLSISHAMTRGLSAVRGARDALHGHQVAYALLVQLVLERRDDVFLADIVQFYRDTELPVCLSDIGMPDPNADEIQRIAEGTMTAPHVKNFERTLDARDISRAIEEVERRSATRGPAKAR